MKTLIALAALAMISTGAFAGEKSHTKEVNTGHDNLVTSRACFPSTGNWVNAATQSCPDQGSGGVGLYETVEVKCEPKRS